MLDSAVKRAVEEIWSELSDRSGIGDALASIDRETREEIQEAMFKIIDDAAYWSWDQEKKGRVD